MMFPISPIWALDCYSSGHSLAPSLPVAQVPSSLKEEIVISNSSRKTKSSLLVLLPIISFNVEKRWIPMESNDIAWRAMKSNGNSPRAFTVCFFLHTGQHTLSFCSEQTVQDSCGGDVGTWQAPPGHRFPATVLRKFPYLCLNCRLRIDGSAWGHADKWREECQEALTSARQVTIAITCRKHWNCHCSCERCIHDTACLRALPALWAAQSLFSWKSSDPNSVKVKKSLPYSFCIRTWVITRFPVNAGLRRGIAAWTRGVFWRKELPACQLQIHLHGQLRGKDKFKQSGKLTCKGKPDSRVGKEPLGSPGSSEGLLGVQYCSTKQRPARALLGDVQLFP